MSKTVYERAYTGEFLISEANGTRSRDHITLAKGQGVVEPGQVLGQVTATQKYVKYSNAATDGSQVAVGILYGRVDATDQDADAVAMTRDVEVSRALLTGLDADAEADLAKVGILVRNA